ncbi:MAG TPA: hypothetical protein VIQ60_07295, partial [Gemmatimonadaceae bacterium]
MTARDEPRSGQRSVSERQPPDSVQSRTGGSTDALVQQGVAAPSQRATTSAPAAKGNPPPATGDQFG